MCVCTHICTFEFHFFDFGGESDNDFHPVINSMSYLFPVLASPHSYPLAPGPWPLAPTLEEFENDCATLRYMDGHVGVLKESP